MIPVLRSLLLCLVFAPAALGQAASVFGRVVDRATGHPIAHAQFILLGEERMTYSDSAGRYELARLSMGIARIAVRAVGFVSDTIIVELEAGQRAERPVILSATARELASVDVAAPKVSYRLLDFERRRQNGRGQYLTEEDIIRSGANNVADAVKNLRGVTYECGGGGGCRVRMTRAPMRCPPDFIVDDHVMNDFGPLTPIRDIVGMEVYTGPAEVPGEYAGRNAGCGIVVIWTRSGPTSPRKP